VAKPHAGIFSQHASPAGANPRSRTAMRCDTLYWGFRSARTTRTARAQLARGEVPKPHAEHPPAVGNLPVQAVQGVAPRSDPQHAAATWCEGRWKKKSNAHVHVQRPSKSNRWRMTAGRRGATQSSERGLSAEPRARQSPAAASREPEAAMPSAERVRYVRAMCSCCYVLRARRARCYGSGGR
jgi:hypothetical protein